MFCLVTLLSFLMPPFILTFWTAHTIYYLKGKNLVLNIHLKTWTLLYIGASQALCVGRVCPSPGLLWCVQRGKRSFSLHPLFTPFLALCAQPYLTNSLEFFKSLCLSPRGSSIPLLLSLFCTLEYSVLLYSHHLLFTHRGLTHVVDSW